MEPEVQFHPSFPKGTFAVWLLFAGASDLISLIPYVGLVASWPFAITFLLYKNLTNKKLSKTTMVSIADFFAEGVFSSIPANTADVLITYMMSKIADKAEMEKVNAQNAEIRKRNAAKMKAMAQNQSQQMALRRAYRTGAPTQGGYDGGEEFEESDDQDFDEGEEGEEEGPTRRIPPVLDLKNQKN